MTTNVADLPFNKAELPSRDVPRETISHVTDPQVTQSYVPPREPDYIDRQMPELKQSKIEKLLDRANIHKSSRDPIKKKFAEKYFVNKKYFLKNAQRQNGRSPITPRPR